MPHSTPHLVLLAVLALALACTSTPAPTASPNDTAAADTSGSDTTSEVAPDTTPDAPAELDAGPKCPELAAGLAQFQAGGFPRRAHVFLPADAKGKGLLFLWHGLGDNAKNFSTVFALKTIADKLGLAVVAPDSCCNTPGAGACCNLTTAWNFIDHQERDLELFDTVRQCMAQQHGVDTKRLYTMGFSAGALWSTTLVIHRSEALAAAAVLSGGVNSFVAWQVPKAKVPVLAAAGGQNDVFGGGLVDFQASTEEFEKELRKAGHFVVHCQHQQGHTVPGDIATFAVQFLQPHVQGQPLPFQGGLPGTAPAACKILP